MNTFPVVLMLAVVCFIIAYWINRLECKLDEILKEIKNKAPPPVKEAGH